MRSKALRIAKRLMQEDRVHIVTHNDADGLTAGSIASIALERAAIEHSIEFVKQLDTDVIARLIEDAPPLVWFTDLGSGMLEELRRVDAVITDHHIPKRGAPAVARKMRENILTFAAAVDSMENDYPLQLNPHDFQRDGATDLSGAGATYLIAAAMDPQNIDCAALAIVGAVGDFQDSRTGRLEGTNRRIIADAAKAGVVEANLDLRLYGRESRALPTLLQYADDPPLPGLAGHYRRCERFLTTLNIPLKASDADRHWIDLSEAEKRTICSALVDRILTGGLGHKVAKRLVGEVYTLVGEERGTPLHDAKEFATLLNACGRYDRGEVGYHVCRGDRESWYQRAKKQLQGHRMNIAQTIQIVEELGIEAKDHIQYFHGEDKIMETVVGIVAGKMLGSGKLPRDKPIIGFAFTEDGMAVKVSGRATRRLVKRGVNLSAVMETAAKQFDGVGGGHNIAAGATIRRDAEEAFLACVDTMIARQLGATAAGDAETGTGTGTGTETGTETAPDPETED